MNSTKPNRQPGILARDIGGETLLYSAEKKAIHILNPTARFIWQLCDGRHAVADIAVALQTNFSVAPDRDVTDDVRRTLAVFADKGLLQQTG